MKSLRNTSLVALTILCFVLGGCASTKTATIETTDAAENTAATTPNSGYVTGSTIGDPTGGATAQVTSVNPVPESTSATITTTSTVPNTTVETTVSTDSTMVDDTATMSGSSLNTTGTTGVSGSMTSTTTTTTTSATSNDDMTSSSSLDDQQDDTTTSTTTTRTRMRKD